MNVETRGRAAAEGLRSATSVNVEAGLSRLRHTRRRRAVGRVVVACAAVAAVAGATLVAIDREENVPPAKDRGLSNGPIINAGERQFVTLPTLPSQRPYPAWQGVDPASGSFLYALEGSGSVAIVDKSGTVAEVECPRACELGVYPGRAAFGPGADELTLSVDHLDAHPPPSLLIIGYDGDVREVIDLSDVGLPGNNPKLIAWSPDASELAVAMEDRPEVWIIPRGGSRARLVHREVAPQGLGPRVVDLAWSPDGSRLGILVANGGQGEEGEPGSPSKPRPRLIAVPAEGGDAQTLHTFDFRNPHGTVPTNFIRNWAFAWSPDGKRIAVTSEGGIAEISATDGTVLAKHPGVDDSGPLAWLPK